MSRALKSLAIFFAFVAIYTLSRHVVSPSSTTTSVTSSTIVSTTSLGATACQGSDFSGVFNQGQGAAGTINASITLTKTSTGTCSIMGWPLLTLQDRTGAVLPSSTVNLPSVNSQVGFPDPRANRSPSSLTLKRGAATTFSLAYSDVPSGSETSCPSATTLSVEVRKGGNTVTVTPEYPLTPCSAGTVWVSPFY